MNTKKCCWEKRSFSRLPYNNLATVYHAKKDYDKAIDLFCRAVVIMILNDLSNHPDTKSTLNSLLMCYLEYGGKKSKFKEWFDERITTYPQWCNELNDG